MLNALQINKKNYTLSTFPSRNRWNFEDSRKVLAISVFEFCQSIAVKLYQPHRLYDGPAWFPFSANSTTTTQKE